LSGRVLSLLNNIDAPVFSTPPSRIFQGFNAFHIGNISIYNIGHISFTLSVPILSISLPVFFIGSDIDKTNMSIIINGYIGFVYIGFLTTP
jgi:hypothetical protein